MIFAALSLQPASLLPRLFASAQTFVWWNWKTPVGQIIVPSFSSLSLPLLLEGSNAIGASEAQERSLGKKEQRAVRLQQSPLRTSSLPRSSLPWSLSLPSPHWPAPQIKTSDKKMGSLKKGEKEREKEVHNKPRGAKQQSLCCWMAGPLCRSARNCHCVNLDPSLRGAQT